MEKMIGDRISTLTEKDKTSIVIYPKRERFKEALLFGWVVAFTIVGIYMIYLLAGGLHSIDNTGIEGDPEEIIKNQKIYITVFLGFWLYFEFKVVSGLLWLLFGKELILINNKGLTIKNSIFGYGKARTYFHENIKNLGLVEHKPFSFGFDYENAFWRKGTDTIIFDYLHKTISFGKKLNEKDAKLLMRFIADRLKRYAKSK